MNFTYTLVLSWLILPAAIDVLLPRNGELGRAVYLAVAPVNAWVAVTSPFSVWIDVTRGAIVGASALLSRVLWMIVLQTIYGALASALAVRCLRSSFLRRVGGRGRSRIGVAGRRESAGGSRAALESRRRPPCGDDPMIWKELMSGTSVFSRPSVVVIVMILGALLVASTTALATPALGELLREGYGIAPAGSARVTFHSYLRIVGTGIALAHLLGIASDAAASLTSERENETWISLITTPLSGTEIIRAKLLGAIWEIRHTALVLTALWLLGVLVGSVHPLGLIAALAELAAYTGFTAAPGDVDLTPCPAHDAGDGPRHGELASAQRRIVTGHAADPGRPSAGPDRGPLLLALTLASTGDLQGQPAAGSFGPMADWVLGAVWVGRGPEMVLTCLASVLGATLGAWALIRSSCHGFDACLDRPTLTGPGAVSAAMDASPGGPLRPRPRLRSSQRGESSRCPSAMTVPEPTRLATVSFEPGMTSVDDPACGFTITVGVGDMGVRPIAQTVGEQPAGLIHNRAKASADQLDHARLEGFGALGGFTHDQNGLSQTGSLLLNSSGVGQDEFGSIHQGHERHVGERLDQVEVSRLPWTHCLVDLIANARVEMQGVDEGGLGEPSCELEQLATDRHKLSAETLASMGRDQHEGGRARVFPERIRQIGNGRGRQSDLLQG